MADNELRVPVSADTSSFEAGMKKVSSSADKALDDVNKNLGKTQEKLEETGEAGKDSAKGMEMSFADLATAIGGAFVITKFTGFLKDASAAALEQEKADTKLAQALRSIGDTSGASMAQLKAYASTLQMTTGASDDAIQGVQSLLISMGRLSDVGQINRATKAALDFAAATGTSAEAAAELFAKAAQGNTAALARYGLVLDENIRKGEKLNATLALMERNFGGTAEAIGKTAGGQLAVLGQQFGEAKEAIGNFVNDGIAPYVSWLAKAAKGTADLTNYLLDLKRGIAQEKELGGINENLQDLFISMDKGMQQSEAMQQARIRILALYPKEAEAIFNNARAMGHGTTSLETLNTALQAHIQSLDAVPRRAEMAAKAVKEKAASDALAAEETAKLVKKSMESITELPPITPDQMWTDASRNPFIKSFMDAQNAAFVMQANVVKAFGEMGSMAPSEAAKMREAMAAELLKIQGVAGTLTSEGAGVFQKLTGLTPESYAQFQELMAGTPEEIARAQDAISDLTAEQQGVLKSIFGIDPLNPEEISAYQEGMTQIIDGMTNTTNSMLTNIINGSQTASEAMSSFLTNIQSQLLSYFTNEAVMFAANAIKKALFKKKESSSVVSGNMAQVYSGQFAAMSTAPFPINLTAPAVAAAMQAAALGGTAAAGAAGAGVGATAGGAEKGGIVGGASFTGDKLLARINSGEGVLTADTVSQITKDLSGGAMTKTPMGAASQSGGVTIIVEGDSLDTDGLVAKISGALNRAHRSHTLDFGNAVAA